MSAKWCRFQAGDKVSYGRIEEDSVVALDGAPWGAHTVTSTRHRLSAVKLLIPTVRLGLRDDMRSDRAAASGSVLDYHGLT